ncbi:hypothetical protein AGMMS49983_01300 [Clostridia bacterium]|nr:hypothetical protein AGMMS49983_01300 [Clostridia bacterium]
MPLISGAVIYQCQIDETSADNTKQVGLVRVKADDPLNVGIKNISDTVWYVKRPNEAMKAIAPGSTVKIVPGTQINIGPYSAEVVSHQAPSNPSFSPQALPPQYGQTVQGIPRGPEKKPRRTAWVCVVVAILLAAGAYYLFFANGGENNPFKKNAADGAEVEKILAHLTDEDDDDGDGLNNYFESYYKTDKNKPDTDEDGLSDYIEITVLRTDPLKADSDGNGVNDGDEDADGDGLSNRSEITSGTDPALSDTDFDGVDDADEINVYGTDPANPDTDGDQADDGWEIEHGFDPLTADASFDIQESRQSEGGDATVSLRISLPSGQAETLHIDEVTSHSFLNEEMPGYIMPAYDFSVTGEFETAEISFTFDESLLGEPDFAPTIYWVNPDTKMPEEQPTTINGNVATATVTHFSQYVVLDKRSVDTSKPFGSTEINEYEDVDFDGLPNSTDPHPFDWDISDRDLLMCSGIAYYDFDRSYAIDELPQSMVADIDNKAYPGYTDATVSELRGWKIEKCWQETNGFSATLFKKDNKIVLAFGGTDSDADIKEDLLIYSLNYSQQDRSAENAMREVLQSYSGYEIYLTGHSLGGHLAYKAAAYDPSKIKKVVTFNGLGLHGTFDRNTIDKLAAYKDKILSYKANGDWVSRLSMCPTPGKTIDCDTEATGYVPVVTSAHQLSNFFNNTEPYRRNMKDVSKDPIENNSVEAPAQSSEPPSAPVPEAPVSGDIRITGVSPTSAIAGQPTSFSVTVDYSFENTANCVIVAGANTDEDADIVNLYEQYDVFGNGSYTFHFSCTPTRRADNIFIVYVEIALPGGGVPLDSDAYSMPLSGTSYDEEFAIEGKWKQTGEKTFGQAQKGAIIVFDGVHCNWYSPQDTYACYKSGDNLRLDVTSLLFAENLSFDVVVIDNEHIEIDAVQLVRVG